MQDFTILPQPVRCFIAKELMVYLVYNDGNCLIKSNFESKYCNK